jgi:hypothetical protein
MLSLLHDPSASELKDAIASSNELWESCYRPLGYAGGPLRLRDVVFVNQNLNDILVHLFSLQKSCLVHLGL